MENDKNRIVAEQTRSIYTMAPVPMLAPLANSLFLAVFLWGSVSNTAIILWVSVNWLLTFGRYALIYGFHKAGPPDSGIRKWKAYFNASVLLAGLAFGSAGVFLFPMGSMPLQALLAIVLAGMVAGATAAYNIQVSTYFLYSIPVFLPVVIRNLLIDDMLHLTIAMVGMVYYIIMSVSAWRMGVISRLSLSLRFENIGLVERLTGEIHQRRNTEEKLREMHDALERAVGERTEELANLFDLSMDMICISSMTHFLRVSPSFERTLGYKEKELLESPYMEFIHPDDAKPTRDIIKEKLGRGQSAVGFINRFRHKDGTYRWLEWMSNPSPDKELIYSVARDITERKIAEERIKKSLGEKEVLLKEVHHRVKNNLSVIASLLNMQSEFIYDDKYLQMFKESESRIWSMALVHKMLYQDEDFSRIDVGEYIKSLVKSIKDTFAGDAKIRTTVEVSDIPLDIDTLVPCGLIINELVTNSFKHAFHGHNGPGIRVSMTRLGSGQVSLKVSDNGKGLPEGYDITKSEGLGSMLVNALAIQIEGTLEIRREKGTTFNITFPVKPDHALHSHN
jgi:PAS domain S-box-containing protein